MQNLYNEVIGDVSPVGNVRVLIWTDVDDEPIVGIDEDTRQETYYVPDPGLRQDALEIEADWREINEALFEAGDLQLQTGSSELLVNAEGREATNPSLTGNGQSFQSFMQSITGSSTSGVLVPESTVNQELQEKLNAKLKPDHLEDLRKSGLSDEMIDKMGCVSMVNHEIHEKIYGTQEHSSKWNGATGYSIPYVDSNGQTILTRYRMFWCEHAIDVNSKPPKYLSPKDASTEIYVPPGFADIEADYLIITEGEKKAAKAVQEGFPCVALAGVDMWADSKLRAVEKANNLPLSYNSPIHRTLLKLAQKKKVIVLFDSDTKSNPAVLKARARLTDALLYQATTWCLAMDIPTPNKAADKKVGLDDLLITAEGKNALKDEISLLNVRHSSSMTPLFELRCKKDDGTKYRYVVPNRSPLEQSDDAPKLHMLALDEDGKIERKPISKARVWLSRIVQSIDDGGEMHYELSYVPHSGYQPMTLVGDSSIISISNSKDDLLGKYGAKVLPREKSALEEFLVDCQINGIKQKCVTKTSGTKRRGWREPDRYLDEYSYVLDSKIITRNGTFCPNDANAPLIPLEATNDGNLRHDLVVKGDFSIWKQAIEEHVLYSALPALIFAGGMAGLLRKHCSSSENFILHVYGPSSAGKTMAIKAAASVWGNPKRLIDTWKATTNGLERKAVNRNDMALFLDEAGMADEKELMDAIYSIGNGGEKTRANKNLGNQKTSRYEIVALSSGEKQLVRGTKFVGQEVRALEIPVDIDGDYWKTIRDVHVAEEFSRILDDNYGYAIEPMIRGILFEISSDKTALSKYHCKVVDKIRSRFSSLPQHISRRIKHFGLCLTAMYVFDKHVLEWSEEFIDDHLDLLTESIIAKMVNLPTDQFKVNEEIGILKHFLNQLAEAQSKFLIEGKPMPHNLYGSIEGSLVFCIPGPLGELIRPYDNARLVRAAESIDALLTRQHGKRKTISHRIGGVRPDCYVFDTSKIEEAVFKDE